VAARREGVERGRVALRPIAAPLALLRSGRMNSRPMISRVFALNSAPEAIRYAQRTGVLKVLLQ